MTHAPTSRRPAALLGFWLLAAYVPLASLRAAATDEITVRILNASPETLRCVTVLAHFITRDLPTLQPSGSVSIVLERDPGSGSLSYGHHGDKPMFLENILCGHEADWTASRQDIPLQALRAASAESFSIACHGDGGSLACDPPASP